MPDEIYRLPDLPYDYGALEPHVSGRIMELHHDKHHAAYVKGANTALEKLHEARQSDEFDTITQLEKNLAFHLSGHVLHSIFWTNLAPDGGDPSPALCERFDELGGIDRFRRHMTEAAATIQGSGWALAAWEPVSRRIVVQQVYDHQGNHGQGTVPLLAIDAWEHAYYLQYTSDKGAFFDAVWNVVNWPDVERRLVEASGSAV
ncbi:MAG: superoxide dismutase [Actinomycetota bacterium]|nr:superoxide dismutase [Actinomycetota bacterium]